MIALVLLWALKVFMSTINTEKRFIKNIALLQEKLSHETANLKLNNDQVQLSDAVTKTLVFRIFDITRELLLIQKLIFSSKEI
ncbi:hypothetical protein PK35_10410 [Tamlana nanhaiensis]|uniref:Uncharacterized protein n=2 Tax=Neotamlana nanhaiensis TaxID=1382798 RepID=A0A0D7W412_9FLAO|nr:hypothetical protein PK35_10410 [Tamlana nanhaiensis]